MWGLETGFRVVSAAISEETTQGLEVFASPDALL